ncbi:MAG: hypothetical protein ABI208_05760 [Ginsengibacter sp.]|jgi:hypothetical protein
MTKIVTIALALIILSSCAANKKVVGENDLPDCLKEKVVKMAEDPSEGTPLYITRYEFQGKMVYYMASPCCDKYNVVYDRDCKILGYPDGGLTGKGDGSLPNFRQDATNAKVIWAAKQEKK